MGAAVPDDRAGRHAVSRPLEPLEPDDLFEPNDDPFYAEDADDLRRDVYGGRDLDPDVWAEAERWRR